MPWSSQYRPILLLLELISAQTKWGESPSTCLTCISSCSIITMWSYLNWAWCHHPFYGLVVPILLNSVQCTRPSSSIDPNWLGIIHHQMYDSIREIRQRSLLNGAIPHTYLHIVGREVTAGCILCTPKCICFIQQMQRKRGKNLASQSMHSECTSLLTSPSCSKYYFKQ